MPEDRHTSDPEVKAWRLSVEPGSAEEVRDGILAKYADSGAQLLILESRMVFGRDHLASAHHHALKAVREGRNASDSMVMETMLYASGERQLGNAIRKMNVGPETSEIVIALLGGDGVEPEGGWRPLADGPEDVPEDRYLRFGFVREELGTVRVEKRVDLVLERVAAVDVLKR